MLLTIAAFILVLGVLIFVHELGHFLAAKAVGIGVPRFSIGFGPATPLSFRRGETEYQVAWIPLGGYVKMASREEQEAMAALEGGETGEEFPPDKLFESKPLWARILVISAGVLMNALFAWAVYAGLAAVYGQTQDPTTTFDTVLAESLPEGAEALAGLPHATRVTAVNGEPVASWDAIVGAVMDPTTDGLSFELEGGRSLEVPIRGLEIEKRKELADSLIPLWEARVGTLVEGRPAHRAGLELGDRITAIDGRPIGSWYDMVQVVEKSAGEELVLEVERGDERLEVPVTPGEETLRDPLTGEARKVGRIGIGPQLDFVRVRFGPLEAIVEGARRTLDDGGKVLFALKGMILGDISPKELGGPILIGQASGQFARAGFVALLVFMAFLSVNLAILNLLPIPVLDGGHLIFLLAEGVRGKPLSLDVRHRLTQAGFLVLMLLMGLALFNDVLRLIRG